MFKKIFLSLILVVFLHNHVFGAELKIIGGSTSIKTILEPIQAAFENKTGVKLTLIPAGSKKGIQELDNGNCDAASTAHNLKELLSEIEKENIKLKNAPAFKTHTIYKETNYSVIVNENNPVNKLSKEQLKLIFTGKIRNWKGVGGNDLPISVIWGKLAEGTKNEVKKRILDNENPIESSAPATTDTSIINLVLNDPKSISVVATASINTDKVKIVKTPEIKSNPIILVTVGEPNKLVQLLIDFIQKEGHKYIKINS